jgi:hypothetical protein
MGGASAVDGKQLEADFCSCHSKIGKGDFYS